LRAEAPKRRDAVLGNLFRGGLRFLNDPSGKPKSVIALPPQLGQKYPNLLFESEIGSAYIALPEVE
jgi:hypothetical protein